jgi:hypothetical protein
MLPPVTMMVVGMAPARAAMLVEVSPPTPKLATFFPDIAASTPG